MSYKIVIDSCGELLDEWKKDPRFESVALTLSVGGENIIDDENFDQASFLKKVADCPECPKSACPSPERYMRAFDCDADHVYAVTLSAEGTNYTADLNGDGAADFFKYRTEVAEDGSTTSLIVNMNGTDYTVGTGISAAYKVEVCDLNTSDNQLNLVVVGTGADNSVTSFRVFNGTDLSTPLMQDGTFTVLNGYGNAARLYNTSHVLTPSSANGTFDENGGFTLAVTSPISIDSLGRYVCKIPYELKDGVITEDALSETTGNYEYELVDLTSQEQFNYILAADTNLLSSAAADAAPAATLGTGTQVFPRKLIQAANEPGAFYLYVEDASGNAGYLPLGEGQTLFQSVPQ